MFAVVGLETACEPATRFKKNSGIAYLHDMLFHHDRCAGLKNNFHQSI